MIIYLNNGQTEWIDYKDPMPDVFRLIAEHVSPDLVKCIEDYVGECIDQLDSAEDAIDERDMVIDEYHAYQVETNELVEALIKTLKTTSRWNKDKVKKSLEDIHTLTSNY